MEALPRRPQLEVMLDRRGDRRGCAVHTAAAAAGYRSIQPTCLLTHLAHWLVTILVWFLIRQIWLWQFCWFSASNHLVHWSSPTKSYWPVSWLPLLPITDVNSPAPAGYGSSTPAPPPDSTTHSILIQLFRWLLAHLLKTNPLKCVFHSLIEEESDDFYGKSSPAGAGQPCCLEDCGCCRGW